MAKKNNPKVTKTSVLTPKQNQTNYTQLTQWQWLEKNAIYIVGIITLIGFGFRIYRVDFLTLWVDEYIHVMRARNVLLYDGSFIDYENNGLFLTFFITFLFKIFGITEFWARFPSVLMSTLSIPLIYQVGKKLFNTHIGIFSAFISAFSWYLIFWSKMARNYAVFEFSFLLLLLVFINLMEKEKPEPTSSNLLKKWGVSTKHLIWLIPTILFSFLNHQLTFFFAFVAGFYGSIVAIKEIIQRKKGAFFSKYAIFFYLNIILCGVMFMPFFGELARPLFRLFLPDWAITWILPNWTYLSEVFADPEKRFTSFDIYHGVLHTDFTIVYYLGIIGLLLSYFNNFKGGAFLTAGFLIPSLLMSFIFRDPALPRYLIYIYPLFIISASSAIYFIFKQIFERFLSQKIQSKPIMKFATVGLTFWLVFIDVPFKELKAFLNTEEHGRVVPKELSHWAFVDWKYPCNYVGKLMQENDIILATVQKPTDFYLGINHSLRFRQRHLDTKIRQYVENKPDSSGNLNAKTTNDFVHVVNNTPRGWLLADYYFYNALTAPEARNFAIRYLDFHFDASKDGGVHVFSWDRTKQPSREKAFLVVLGKGNNMASQEMTIDATFANQAPKVKVYLDAEAIDHNQEAILVVNKQNSVYIPRGKTNGREIIEFELNSSWFKPEKNTIQFGYNEQKVTKVGGNIDFRKGFAIYNFSIAPAF